MARWFGRIVFALMGAAFGAFAVAMAEARQAVAGAGGHAPTFPELTLAEGGVLAPIAMLVGAAVALASIFLEPERPVAPTERIARVRAQSVLLRSRTAALSLLTGLAATGWLVVTAHSARTILSTGGGFNADANERTRRPLPVIATRDIEAMEQKVVSAGGRIIMPTFAFPGGRRFHFVDPEGNELAVMQPDTAPSQG